MPKLKIDSKPPQINSVYSKVMGNLLRDIRYAFRTLIRARGFAAIAVATLALGIGANTAIFSLVHTVLLKPLPYRDPARLIVAWDTYLPQDKYLPMFPKMGVAPPELDLWRHQTDVLEDTGWYRYIPYDIDLTAAGGDALNVRAGFLSTNFLQVMGVPPALGSGFAAGEPPHSVLLSHRLWQTHFASDAALVGKTIRMGGEGYTVAGVMPAGFQFPDWADVWLPPRPLNGR